MLTLSASALVSTGQGQSVGSPDHVLWYRQPATNPGASVVWQAELPKPQTVESYSFTSANDVPERDPQEWVLEGSLDGTQWTVPDRRNTGQPFEARFQTKSFSIGSPSPCRIATRKAFGDQTRGWTARTSQNIFGVNGWEWNIPASAWYAQHFYEHWAFTQDAEYRRRQGYPPHRIGGTAPGRCSGQRRNQDRHIRET